MTGSFLSDERTAEGRRAKGRPEVGAARATSQRGEGSDDHTPMAQGSHGDLLCKHADHRLRFGLR